MRKDTRIGVAIGLVLFAVLIAYAVVGSKTSPKKKVTLDTTGRAAASTDDFSVRGGAPSGSASGEAKEIGSGAAPLNAVETSDPSAAPAGNGANWAALLSATEKLDTSVHTKTPDMDHGIVIDPHSTDATPARRNTGNAMETPAAKPQAGAIDAAAAARKAGPLAAANATHKVESDETFTSIARAVYGDGKYASAIAKANPNVDARRLRPGTTLQLPDKAQVLAGTQTAGALSAAKATPASAKIPAATAGKEYAVQADDSLYKISVKVYGKADKVDAIYELNKQQIGSDPAKLRPGMVLKLPQSTGAAVTTVSSAAH